MNLTTASQRMYRQPVTIIFAVLVIAQTVRSEETQSIRPFLGSWAFELPDGNPTWLRVLDSGGETKVELLWSVGSAAPVNNVQMQGGELTFERHIDWKPYGNAQDTRTIRTPFVAQLRNDSLELTATQFSQDGKSEKLVLLGKRMPPIPPRPDLSRVEFGDPIRLFNGIDLSGWRLTNSKKRNGWRVENGILINVTPKTDFGAYGDFGNLRTDREFDDFQLSIEYNVSKGGNSGIYLRGMYEAQVVDRDSSMQGINGPGAIFGRIAPTANAGRTGDDWNRYVLTLVDRHVTVTLNDKTVIDNEAILGCTGGGMSADDTKPGPIFLQGDHTSVKYRNIVLRPVRRNSRVLPPPQR